MSAVIKDKEKQNCTTTNRERMQRCKINNAYDEGCLSSKRGSCEQYRKPIHANYIREVDLISLIALWPKELEDYSLKGTEIIIRKLRSAIRTERKSGKMGHWSYNLNKHAALVRVLKKELIYLETAEKKSLKSKTYPQDRPS